MVSALDPETQLAALLGESPTEIDVGRRNRVFCNRNLRMDSIEMIGFDMDYTLALYHQAKLETLSIELTLRKMIENHGYPPEVMGLDYDPRRAIRGLTDWLNQMGQPRHLWPPPDGYPDVSAAWASNLLPRWNFSLALARNNLPGINVPLEAIVSAAGVSTSPEIIGLFGQIAGGRALDPATAELLTNYVSAGPPNNRAVRADLEDAVGLLFASPTFQWT